MRKSSRSKVSPWRLLKYDATGNRFVLVERLGDMIPHPGLWAREACVDYGVDGLLLMEPSEIADMKMRIFNPDGSEVQMCGNGSRCAAHWASHEKGLGSSLKIETGAGILQASVEDDQVRIKLTDPAALRRGIRLETGAEAWEITSVDTGVPHAVIQSENIEALEVERIGRRIRHAEIFKPQGTNVTFYRLLGPNLIRVRTYERGVEGETLSCGTGATAAALVAHDRHGMKSPVRALTQSREELKIYFVKRGTDFTDVFLEGKVRRIGEVNRTKGERT